MTDTGSILIERGMVETEDVLRADPKGSLTGPDLIQQLAASGLVDQTARSPSRR